VTQNIHERLHREPYYVHPKLKFIPNIVINLISFFIAFALIATLVYRLIHFLIDEFYHLK